MQQMRLTLTIIIAILVSIVGTGQTLEQTAGIYYAYPGPQLPQTPVPDGYKPFYISHYGRHGSRWITEDERYTSVLEMFDSVSDLTPLGRDVRQRLEAVTADALGKSGCLSPVGTRQHRQIAQRMYQTHPEVFTDTSTIVAVSSTAGRCMMSMHHFLESLKENNPALRVQASAYQRDMQYIAFTSDEGKKFSAKDAPWREEYWAFVGEMVNPKRLVESLFISPSSLTDEQQFALVTGLYWIASDMQDVEVGVDFYDIFTYEELRNMWRCINARMYMCNGNAPANQGVMKHCSDNLLDDILQKAQAAIDGNGVSANLRFGHDTHLLRLIANMGLKGCDAQETDMRQMHTIWQDYRLSPMAANLQMILYKNDKGDIIGKFLLNEDETYLPLDEHDGPYYPWPVIEEYLKSPR